MKTPIIGEKVQKLEGYPFPGVIVAVFETTKKQQRVVVECRAPFTRGCLHIFSLKQLERISEFEFNPNL